MSSDRSDGKMIEEDHPQTRDAEPNARGSSQWNEDVVLPPDERSDRKDREKKTVAELAEEAAETRREAIDADSPRRAFGSDKASGE